MERHAKCATEKIAKQNQSGKAKCDQALIQGSAQSKDTCHLQHATNYNDHTLTKNHQRLCKTESFDKRVPLTAEQKHQVNHRDKGQCTFVDQHGKRCENKRWVHIHHIRHVQDGGTNDPDNLTTLCAYHHDLTHQLTLPIEGQITWLREPIAPYGVPVTYGVPAKVRDRAQYRT